MDNGNDLVFFNKKLVHSFKFLINLIIIIEYLIYTKIFVLAKFF